MEATFYKFGTNKHGYFVQDKTIDFKKEISKKDLFNMVKLDHPVLSNKDYFNILLSKKTFLSSNHYITIL
jgi:hypothetical protein